jgi:zinc D-Ala-D-Ala carboxypeptidase
MKLSTHLMLAEMIRSDSAKRRKISNTPNPEHLDNMKVLAKMIFEPIRNFFKAPIYISSGYRSEALNKAIKGSSSSQHCKGQAMDIDMDGSGNISNSQVFSYIKDNLDFDQLIWEFGDNYNPDWVHVSYVSTEKNRKQILVAYKFLGMTKYRPYK